MATIWITDEQVERALELRSLLGSERDQWLHDNDLKGFAVRLSRSGKAYAHFNYWVGGRGGKVKRITIGEISKKTLTVDQARQKVWRFKDQLANGEDPKAAHERARAETFSIAWGLFTKSWSDENRYRRECKALVKKDALPALGGRPLAMITRRDIAPAVDIVSARSQSRSWELFKNLRLCFNWCVQQGLLETSPMDRMKPPKAVPSRARVLVKKEIGAFWRASGQLEFPWQQIFRLLLLTAARRGEVGGMRWAELDLEAATWTLPGERSKNDEEHVVDLPDIAIQILNETPKVYDLVFSTTGDTPPSGYGKSKKQLDKLIRADIGQIKPFRLHDLRHTIVTTLSEHFEYDDELGERILNHKKKGIMKVYNIATRRKERKEALLKWSEYVLSLDRNGKTNS